MNNIRYGFLLSLLGLAFLLGTPHVHAAPDCSGDALISESFSNGARWEMCWESRIRENLVLNDVYYTPPDGTAKKILSSARLSQLHVAYDDSDVTYNDITQYGLGGGYLLELTDADCPVGDLLIVQTRPAICQWRSTGNDNYRTPSRSVSAESFTLFSVSQVGAYAYIVTWTFYSDGAIKPEVGATGALQRSSDKTELPFGRVLSGSDDTLWLSHTHNYYWRLDFDLGDSATDDVVTETTIKLNETGQRRTFVERFDIEQARVVSSEFPVSWEIWEKLAGPLPGAEDAGYRIEPIRYGHRLVRAEKEPYTEFDFFVTVVNECERFASQNARFNPDCLNQVAQYTNGESLVNADLTIWHRVGFHHAPRNEDQRHMHTHWDSFVVQPINMHASTPGVNIAGNSNPVLVTIKNQSNAIGDNIDLQVNASDSDDDKLQFRAENLPTGLYVSEEGKVIGTIEMAGTFNVDLFVTDDIATDKKSFVWTVSAQGKNESNSDGWFGATGPIFLLTLFGCIAVRMSQRRY